MPPGFLAYCSLPPSGLRQKHSQQAKRDPSFSCEFHYYFGIFSTVPRRSVVGGKCQAKTTSILHIESILVAYSYKHILYSKIN